MTSGTLIREARKLAGLSQVELSRLSGKDRAQLARWERDVVQPSLETLRELLQVCGYDLELSLVPYESTRSMTRASRSAAATHRRSGCRRC